MSSYQFLRHVKDPLPASISNTPIRYMRHNSFILGEKVIRPGSEAIHESGYQVIWHFVYFEICLLVFLVFGHRLYVWPLKFYQQLLPYWVRIKYLHFGLYWPISFLSCLESLNSWLFGIASSQALWLLNRKYWRNGSLPLRFSVVPVGLFWVFLWPLR